MGAIGSDTLNSLSSTSGVSSVVAQVSHSSICRPNKRQQTDHIDGHEGAVMGATALSANLSVGLRRGRLELIAADVSRHCSKARQQAILGLDLHIARGAGARLGRAEAEILGEEANGVHQTR